MARTRPAGDATYGDPTAWQRETAIVMTELLALFDAALPALAPR